MRARQLNLSTLRETPADAEVVSHQLLLRAGFMSKSGAGIYVYSHLLQRVIDKIKAIIVEEITEAGGVEVTLPILQEQSLWQRSGRWEEFQQSRTMLTSTDRNGTEFGLSPTAEEVVTDYADQQVVSYKQLPVCYFQQHTKFRDEIRPRFGLMRVKEFIMMDAYSFHAQQACLQNTYTLMRDAYTNIFNRCGLTSFPVEADGGAIGGDECHEFMVAADVGEDAILFCSASGYAANSERAEGRIAAATSWQAPAEPLTVPTPEVGSIDEVVAYLSDHADYAHYQVKAQHTIKCLLFIAETNQGPRSIAANIRGDRQLNEIKLINQVRRALHDKADVQVFNLRPMNVAEIEQSTSAQPGFAGPGPGLQVDQCWFDQSLIAGQPDEQAVHEKTGWVIGANQTDAHIIGYRIPQHTENLLLADLTLIEAGDGCPRCGAPLEERRGIEVGHIFQLGSKYSAAMNATFTAENGKSQPFLMGCYGIGTSRLAAAAVEVHHDERGIVWPSSIAPYHIVLVPTRWDKADQREAAEQVYRELKAAGLEVIIDDRDAKAGVKFKDWDLVGIPCKVVFGRALADGQVEVKGRTEREAELVNLDQLVAYLSQKVHAAFE